MNLSTDSSYFIPLIPVIGITRKYERGGSQGWGIGVVP